jgi:hypothetical protein|tara:strand:- start:16951 stop:17346 length:396 start_codon:yes stop_codon:yes gene_type:complete
MKTITSPRLNTVSISPKLYRKRANKTVTRASKDDTGINWKYVEAINGRAAMYGTILGAGNWGLTGLNVIEQTHYLPFSIMGLGASLISIGTMTNAISKLSDEDFETFALINTGRLAMVCFTGLVTAAIAGV